MTGTRGQCSHHSFQLAKVGVQQGHFGRLAQSKTRLSERIQATWDLSNYYCESVVSTARFRYVSVLPTTADSFLSRLCSSRSLVGSTAAGFRCKASPSLILVSHCTYSIRLSVTPFLSLFQKATSCDPFISTGRRVPQTERP